MPHGNMPIIDVKLGLSASRTSVPPGIYVVSSGYEPYLEYLEFKPVLVSVFADVLPELTELLCDLLLHSAVPPEK